MRPICVILLALGLALGTDARKLLTGAGSDVEAKGTAVGDPASTNTLAITGTGATGVTVGTVFANAAGAKKAATKIESASQSGGAGAAIKLGSEATTAPGGLRAVDISAGGTYATTGGFAGGSGFTSGSVLGPGAVTGTGKETGLSITPAGIVAAKGEQAGAAQGPNSNVDLGGTVAVGPGGSFSEGTSISETDTSKALSEVLAAGGRPVGSFIPISLADTKAKTAVLVNAAQALGEAEAIGATTTTATQTSTQVTP